MTAKSVSRPTQVALAVYVGMMLVYLIGAFAPGYRTWGINWWAYFSGWAPWVLLVFGLAVAGYLLYSGQFGIKPSEPAGSPPRPSAGHYALISAVLVILFGFTFFLLRTQTHFLGDGYNILTQLETANPLVKTTSLGEGLLHNFAKTALSGTTDAALLSFQIISIVSGIGFVILSLVAAAGLFERLSDRLIFTLGLLSGGYLLLFFGYVEYYSVFALSVAAFTLVGLLIARGKLNRLWILPFLALSLFLHVFGLALVPAAVYLLLSDTPFGRKLTALSTVARLVLVLVVALVGVTAFLYFYNDGYAFRLAFIPFVQNRFTVDGYTLMSWQHVRDLLNLWILLVPAAPLFVALAIFLPRSVFKGRDTYYLLVLTISVLLVTIVANPVLGMPRDWDLFAFAGLPLTATLFYLLLKNRSRITGFPAIATLAIALGFFVLIPRVVGQVIPDIGIKHFESYLERNRPVDNKARAFLVEYYRRNRDSVGELKTKVIYERYNLEGNLLSQGNALFDQDMFEQAATTFRRAITANPRSGIAYSNLGKCYLRFNKPDSALILQKIALALNPYDAVTLNNLGLAYYYVKDYDHAERCWIDALARDTSLLMPRLFLMRQYKELNQPRKFDSVVVAIADRPDLPVPVLEDIGRAFLAQKRYKKAGQIIRRALDLGLDPAKVEEMKKYHPFLVVPPK